MGVYVLTVKSVLSRYAPLANKANKEGKGYYIDVYFKEKWFYHPPFFIKFFKNFSPLQRKVLGTLLETMKLVDNDVFPGNQALIKAGVV